MRALLQVVLNAVALWVAASLVPGVTYRGGIGYLLLAGLVLGLVNLLVKPLVTFFAFPLIVVTLGLFYLVINGLMLYLAALLVPHHLLQVRGCIPAIVGGLVVALVNWVLRAFVSSER